MEGNGDAEPWLASPNGDEMRSQVGWCKGTSDDGELECEDEGAQSVGAELMKSGIADKDALELIGVTIG